MNKILAIVIPAYKGRYLEETLRSLSRQSVHSFTVYIGDDGSPDDLRAIIAPYLMQLDLVYKRFETNIGRANLTAHWERCIAMTGNEPWLWLLPDDDVASENCVSSFLHAIETNTSNEILYRFQTMHINGDGKIIHEPNPCPPRESNIDFMLGKLNFTRNSSLAEYIFSKRQYQDAGGFVQLPLAWGSDDLLWIRLSQKNDMVTLTGGCVYLRQSELNISANTRDYTRQKFEAKYIYLQEVLSDTALMQKLLQQYSMEFFKEQIAKHLFFEYRSYRLRFFNSNLFRYATLNNRILGGGLLLNMYRLLRYQFTS